MQRAVENRQQSEAGYAEDEDAGEDRIKPGKDLAAIGGERADRPHAGKDHRRIDEGIDGAHALETHIAGHADNEPDDDEAEAPQDVARLTPEEDAPRGERMGFGLEMIELIHPYVVAWTGGDVNLRAWHITAMSRALAAPEDRVIRRLAYEGEAGQWEMLRCAPHAALKPHVIDYSGYRETQGAEIWRRELPCSFVPLIINFGPAFHFRDDPQSPDTQTSFTAGVYTRPVIVGSKGAAFCLQVNFTPLGAWRFFRLAQSELEGRTVSLDDILGAQGRLFVAELYDAPDWPERFALLDDFLSRRIHAAREPNANVREVWQALSASHGAASITALAEATGVSRRHLAKLFRAEIGATPKTMARILRFEHARNLAHHVPRLGWADLAYEAGYADQAHLAREFKELSGMTPQELLRRDRVETGILEQ